MTKRRKINKVCSWCGRHFGTEEWAIHDAITGTMVDSHGICPECYDKEFAEITKARENKKEQ